MFNSMFFVFIALLVVIIFVRRFFSRKRKPQNKSNDLETYIRRHEEEVHSRIEAMRLETRRFDAHEALAPVEAGLRELLALHGNPEDIAIEREDNTLILRSPDIRTTVAWNFRAACRTVPVSSRHVHGKGQWELCLGEDPGDGAQGSAELYTQLDSLMGRLSQIIRAMAARQLQEDFMPGTLKQRK